MNPLAPPTIRPYDLTGAPSDQLRLPQFNTLSVNGPMAALSDPVGRPTDLNGRARWTEPSHPTSLDLRFFAGYPKQVRATDLEP